MEEFLKGITILTSNGGVFTRIRVVIENIKFRTKILILIWIKEIFRKNYSSDLEEEIFQKNNNFDLE